MDIFLQAQTGQGETRSATSRPRVVGVRSTSTVIYGDPSPSTRSAEEEGMPVYELTLQNDDQTEGFAVVVENDDLHDVLAFAPQGAIADTTYNVGLAIWFREMYAMGRDLRSESQTRANEWDDDWEEPEGWESGWDSISNWYAADPIVEEYVRDVTGEEIADGINEAWWGEISAYNPTTYYSPLLKTEWGQRAPYNNAMPYFSGSQRFYAGCGNIAVAQVMAYHKYPAGYDWNTMTATPVITSSSNSVAKNDIARLIYDVNLAMGVDFESATKPEVTTYQANYVPAFNSFGYNAKMTYLGYGGSASSSHSYISDPELSVILKEISHKRPVIMVGQTHDVGHAWVADGYHIMSRWWYHEKDIPGRRGIWRQRFEIALIHFNWGWHGASNGMYYRYRPTGRTSIYSYNKYIWTGISPE